MTFVISACVTSAYAARTSALPAFQADAKSAVLIDALTGTIVFEQNADEKIPPASLIKIMTLYLIYDALDNANLKLTDMVTISERAWKFGGSQMYLEVGMQVPVDDIIKGIAIVSGNDACVAAAEHISGVEETFVDTMNKKAEQLGMKNSSFKNCHGLPVDDQYTTARDMAILSYHYLKDHLHALDIHKMKEMTFNNITQQNRNKLLWRDSSVDGLKTGWIRESGYHLIATAHRNNDRFIAVVMGAKNHTVRENEAMKLLSYGFRNFKTIKLVQTNKALMTVPVWKGTENEVPVGVLETSLVTVPREQAGKVQIEQDVPQRISAPITKNQQVGNVRIMVDGKQVATASLVALAAVPEAGLLKRFVQLIAVSFTTAPYWGIILIVAIVMFFILMGMFRSRMTGSRSKRDNMLT
jgi:D-alanyl-D-alanine carboxypeptidase (penicillin-binding protein 5/6)